MRIEVKVIGFAMALLAGAAVAQTKPATRQDWNTTVALTPQGTHLLGNPAAKVKLTQFISYTCPHCAHFEEQADAQLRLLFVAGGKGSIEVRNFVRDPVDLTVALLTNCGPSAKFFGNHALFLRRQDKWIQPMVHPSPTQQARWSSGSFAQRTRAIAKDFGFYEMMQSRGYTAIQVDKCLADEPLARRLAASTDEAHDKLFITGTPMFAIDGIVLAGTYSWDVLRPQLDARLRAE
ncbi:thioredoxin domain-containing protein [Novosphingobium sp. Gsoil 351]|uniref:thioredoxin domain-containing protein n=1 Tax=Novosphingobium sp. Gsoil 351 TaxID=2675225 RepID=UPI0018A849AA|nr:thioredoxin domain-containing protein [Novosphingobium sp. Gsoil 351]